MRRDGVAETSLNQPHWVDEVITINTQSSTQWDGFKHFGYMNYPKEGVNTFHGGLTQEQAGDTTKKKFGIQSASHSLPSPSPLLVLVVLTRTRLRRLPDYFPRTLP